MKLPFILLCLFSGLTFAQKATIGLKSGLNYLVLDNSNQALYLEGEPTKHGLGWQSGVIFFLPTSEHFSLHTEVNFQQRRFVEYDNTYPILTGGQYHEYKEHNLTYIDIPMMVQYSLQNGLGFHVGIQYGTMLAAKDYYYSEEENYFDAVTGNTITQIQSSGNRFVSWGVKEFSALTGVSYRLKFGLEFELRAQRNVVMICDTDYWSERFEFNTPIYTFQFNMKYFLPVH